MNSRLNEDLAWMRVQDMQREAENRRLMADMRRSGTLATRAIDGGLWAVRKLAAFVARRAYAGPVNESRHHA